MPKPIPTIGQQNWGPTLNSHLAQLQNKDTGGINYGPTRPNFTAVANAGDDGYTFFDTSTKQIVRWNGSSWEVILTGTPNNQVPAITINGQSINTLNISGTALGAFTAINGVGTLVINDISGSSGNSIINFESGWVREGASENCQYVNQYTGAYAGNSGIIQSFNFIPAINRPNLVFDISSPPFGPKKGTLSIGQTITKGDLIGCLDYEIQTALCSDYLLPQETYKKVGERIYTLQVIVS